MFCAMVRQIVLLAHNTEWYEVGGVGVIIGLVTLTDHTVVATRLSLKRDHRDVLACIDQAMPDLPECYTYVLGLVTTQESPY